MEISYIGNNDSFKVDWDCTNQCYNIYYKDKFLIKKYKFSDVQSYLD